MHKVHVFWQLDWAERFLLVEALVVVVAVRLWLWLLPFQTLRARVSEMGQRPSRSPRSNSVSPVKVAWTVRAVSGYVPGATCLTQALAGQVLLARRGHPTCLHLGVSKRSREELAAHAWLECDGRIVLGDHGALGVYTPFSTLE